MNKSLVTLCFVFSLLYLTSAKSIITYQQITEELGNIAKMFDREISCNSSFVPKLGEENVSVAEISCRAIKSLKMVWPSERKHLQALEHYLDFVYTQAKKQVIHCDVSEEEQEDTCSFLQSLHSYFRYKMFNPKP